jgi:hypothetical protein
MQLALHTEAAFYEFVHITQVVKGYIYLIMLICNYFVPQFKILSYEVITVPAQHCMYNKVLRATNHGIKSIPT